MEKTLIILKPDAVDRGLVGEIIARFERKGLRIIGMKLGEISQQTAAKHYQAHEGKPFYHDLIAFMTAGPVVVMALAGPQAISVCRNLMGETAGHKAAPGTIRGDFGLSSQFNLVHGSDSPAAATHELGLFFTPRELLSYERSDARWLA